MDLEQADEAEQAKSLLRAHFTVLCQSSIIL